MFFKAQKISSPQPTTKVLTLKINLNNSNPKTWGEYMDDAVGMTPGSSDFDTFFGHYPCILDNGVELGKLKPSDMSQYEDGTSAPITTLGKDVMIAFPRRGIKIWQEGDYGYISMTDEDNKAGYSYLAHTYKGNACDTFYLGKYKGYVNDTKLYSVSGQTPTTNETIVTFRNYARARGTGYEQSAFYQLTFRQAMYMLKYKGRDAQIAVGRGFVDGNSAIYGATGYTNDKGMDWGESTGKFPVTLFGLEDFFGNIYEYIDGLYSDSDMKFFASDGNYDNTMGGYTAITDKTSTSSRTGYLRRPLLTNEGGFARDVTNTSSGSATTYFCDFSSCSIAKIPYFGGAWDSVSSAGVFQLIIYADRTATAANRGARLMYFKERQGE